MHRALSLGIIVFSCIAVVLPRAADAATSPITYRFKHHLMTVGSASMHNWQGKSEQWTYRGTPVIPPQHLRSEGNEPLPLPEGFAVTHQDDWNRAAIRATLAVNVASQLNQPAGSVRIGRSASGSITFEGVGFPGREVDLEQATDLTIAALEAGMSTVVLPVTETPPAVTVTDPELARLGIREFVTIGESDFHGSTQTRVHNVRVGLEKFNGHLIPQGAVFSFVETLGPVNASTGYKRELVIMGDRTVPDYGGGLCQVSSTAYRGIWEYGFPIVQRKNHSYTVHYYAPQGTDATIYPPYVDMKFRNDSPGALLIQTFIDPVHTKAYFLYYGTRDERTAEVIGPYIWDRTSPPPQRIEYTADLPPGARKKLGEAVPGMKTAWFRIVQKDDEERVEPTYSVYQARPLFWQIGAAAAPPPVGSDEPLPPPDWLDLGD